MSENDKISKKKDEENYEIVSKSDIGKRIKKFVDYDNFKKDEQTCTAGRATTDAGPNDAGLPA